MVKFVAAFLAFTAYVSAKWIPEHDYSASTSSQIAEGIKKTL